MIIALTKEDEKLLIGILAADSQCINEVYDTVLPAVIRWVQDNSGTETDARDIFQEAIIALYKRLESRDFKLTCTLKSFLRIMCRNLWLTRLKRQKIFIKQNEEETQNISFDDNLLEKMEHAARQHLFLKHFEKLGDKCRKILDGFFRKIPFQTIAKELGTSENYVKKRKFVCKEKLTTAIQNDPKYLELKN